jgi:hypothetical protein
MVMVVSLFQSLIEIKAILIAFLRVFTGRMSVAEMRVAKSLMMH